MIKPLNIFPIAYPNITPREPKPALDPWQVEADDFPADGTISEKLKFLLNYAILAPSGHNTQPWLFKIVDDGIELYGDKTRSLSVVDPDDRELIISCGAALFNLRLAIRNFGYEDLVEIFPDGQKSNLLARISFGTKRKVTTEEQSLFRAISQRTTNRLPFIDRQLPASLISELQFAVDSEHYCRRVATLVIPEDKRDAVISLIDRGDRLQMANPLFRQELAKWIRSGNSPHHDGIPVYAQGMDEKLDIIAPLISLAIRSFDLGKSQAAKDCQLATQAPVLILLYSQADNPQDWLATGEALAYLLLQARVNDVWASFFNQPIEIPELRSQLQALLTENGYPQILLRLGYSKETKPTPRRPVDEVVNVV